MVVKNKRTMKKNSKINAVSQKSAHRKRKVHKISNEGAHTNDTDLAYNVDNTAEDDVNSPESSDCETYEKKPRFKKVTNVRNLLPVKSKKGLVFRSEIVDNPEGNLFQNVKTQVAPKSPNYSLVQRYAAQRKTLEDLKRKVALLSTSIIEDPESNISALKELIDMLQNSTTNMIVSEKRILCFSLLHVFMDILPGYRIRFEEEKDKNVKLKKGTKKLINFETNVLRHYKKYLDLLYNLIRKMKLKKDGHKSEIQQKAVKEVALVAVKCMCELLYTKFNFNCFKNIANKIIPLVLEKDEELIDMCCRAFEKLFKADTRGEASYELVAQIVYVIKERKFNVPAALLKTFLCLNLREAKVTMDMTKHDMTKGRKEWHAMSRTQRRNKKQIKGLEAELKEALAHESVENVQKFHTQTLNKIFWVFFHILKDADKIKLIGPSLEGLSNFSYLINLEFFNDLNSVLCSLMESGILSEIDKLHGVYTLFTILAGQAESLHIDPLRIYHHMYQGFLYLNHYTDVEHFELVLKSLEYNIVRKRKRISSNRILAFAKRVSIVCLQTPMHGTLGLLCTLRNILLHVQGSDILLDSESSIGSGQYLPEMEDPEHCNAKSSTLWELHLLKKHFNPVIQLYSQHLLRGCPSKGRFTLPEKLLKSSPEDILKLFADVAVNNKFDFLEEAEEPPKKKIRKDRVADDLSYESDVNLEIEFKDVKHIDFSKMLNCE